MEKSPSTLWVKDLSGIPSGQTEPENPPEPDRQKSDRVGTQAPCKFKHRAQLCLSGRAITQSASIDLH